MQPVAVVECEAVERLAKPGRCGCAGHGEKVEDVCLRGRGRLRTTTTRFKGQGIEPVSGGIGTRPESLSRRAASMRWIVVRVVIQAVGRTGLSTGAELGYIVSAGSGCGGAQINERGEVLRGKCDRHERGAGDEGGNDSIRVHYGLEVTP